MSASAQGWAAVVLMLGLAGIRGAVVVLKARVLRDREKNAWDGMKELTDEGQANPAAVIAVMQPRTFRSYVFALRDRLPARATKEAQVENLAVARRGGRRAS